MYITKYFEKHCYVWLSIIVTLLIIPLSSPLITPWEAANLYPILDPLNYPKLVFSINEGADTSGYWGQHGYFFLRISRVFTDLFGASLLTIRLMPVIYGVISILLIFRVVSLEFTWRAGSIAAVLLATNIPFIVFTHSLLPQGFALMAFLWLLYRYQILVRENSNKNAVVFGLACSLLAIGYLPGRILMILIMFFYFTDGLKIFSSLIRQEISHLQIEKLKKFSVALGSMSLLLAILYPKNIILLFNSGFIFSKLGEYATNGTDLITNVIINAQYFLKYFLLGNQNELILIDVVSNLPYPIETLPVLIISLIGFVVMSFLVKKEFIRLLLMMLVVLMMALMVSMTFPENKEINATTLSNFRVFMVVPFIVIFSSFIVDKAGIYIEERYRMSKLVMLVVIGAFVLSRVSVCWSNYFFYEEFIESFDFNTNVEPSWVEPSITKGELHVGRRNFMDQIYYHHLSRDIAKVASSFPNEKQTKILFISKEKYTPKYLGIHGKIPSGDPYFKELFSFYFEMFLTIYLRDIGMNSAYIFKDNIESNQNHINMPNKCNEFETSGGSIASAEYLLVTTELAEFKKCKHEKLTQVDLSDYLL